MDQVSDSDYNSPAHSGILFMTDTCLVYLGSTHMTRGCSLNVINQDRCVTFLKASRLLTCSK